MKRQAKLAPEFVEFVPPELRDGVIYISTTFATAVHKCCCGCGEKVVTPFSPTDWKLIFDGDSVSLHPSIGNWSFACRSHYWIEQNCVQWAPSMSKEDIDAGRALDRHAKQKYFGNRSAAKPPAPAAVDAEPAVARGGFWRGLKSWFLGR
jgi:hypothetical protein